MKSQKDANIAPAEKCYFVSQMQALRQLDESASTKQSLFRRDLRPTSQGLPQHGLQRRQRDFRLRLLSWSYRLSVVAGELSFERERPDND